MAAGDVTTGTFPTPMVTTASAAGFIPEIWSDEIIAEYEQNLVLAPLVKKMSMKGKKGDTIHVPRPYRGTASAKAASTAVTVISDETDDLPIVINQHWEYSRHIEDIAETQALSTLRQFYTADAGYALAKQLDDYLFVLGTGLGDGTYAAAPAPADWANSNCFRPDSTDGTIEAWAQDTTVAADVFTDKTFRDLLQQLDDDDVPMLSRSFVIPPSLANTMRGIDRYNSSDFMNQTGKVQTGKIGDLYGVDIFVSTNVPVMETSAENAGASVASRGAQLLHKDAYVCAEQVGVRSQTQYQQEYLATLYTADRIYGATTYRPENGVIIAIAE